MQNKPAAHCRNYWIRLEQRTDGYLAGGNTRDMAGQVDEYKAGFWSISVPLCLYEGCAVSSDVAASTIWGWASRNFIACATVFQSRSRTGQVLVVV